MALHGEHPCPQCGQGVLQLRSGRKGQFWGCSRYPQCKAGYDDDHGQPKMPQHICPRCWQGALRLINGKNGAFWGCSRYPTCRAAFNDQGGQPALPAAPTPPSVETQ